MVTPGDQGGSGWRAERRGMEVVVAEAAGGDAVERGRLDRAAEGAAGAEADVIGEDQEHVGRALGRLHTLGEIRDRALDGPPDLTLERRLGTRQGLLRDRWRCEHYGRHTEQKQPTDRLDAIAHGPLLMIGVGLRRGGTIPRRLCGLGTPRATRPPSPPPIPPN